MLVCSILKNAVSGLDSQFVSTFLFPNLQKMNKNLSENHQEDGLPEEMCEKLSTFVNLNHKDLQVSCITAPEINQNFILFSNNQRIN